MPTKLMQSAIKLEAEVQEDGRLELNVPLATGAKVTVFVIEDTDDDFSDLVSAAESSLGFWDNPYDDEDWNDVKAG